MHVVTVLLRSLMLLAFYSYFTTTMIAQNHVTGDQTCLIIDILVDIVSISEEVIMFQPRGITS